MFAMIGINPDGKMTWLAAADEPTLLAQLPDVEREWAHVIIIPVVHWR